MVQVTHIYLIIKLNKYTRKKKCQWGTLDWVWRWFLLGCVACFCAVSLVCMNVTDDILIRRLKLPKASPSRLKSIQLQMDSIKSMSYFSKITNIKNISNIEIYFQYSCIHILTMILLNKAMICNGATLFRKHSYLGSILSIVKLLIILFCTRWNYKTTKWMVSVCII